MKAGPRAEQVAQAEQAVAQADAAWKGAQAQYGQLKAGAGGGHRVEGGPGYPTAKDHAALMIWTSSVIRLRGPMARKIVFVPAWALAKNSCGARSRQRTKG
jgi:hypothetical protein